MFKRIHEDWMPKTLKIMYDFETLVWSGGVSPCLKDPPLKKFWYFDELHFFGETKKLYGVKSVLLFSKLKVKFFQYATPSLRAKLACSKVLISLEKKKKLYLTKY